MFASMRPKSGSVSKRWIDDLWHDARGKVERVSAWAKSAAGIVLAWASETARQGCADRRGRWADARVLEDPPHRRRCRLVPLASRFLVDAAVASGRVVTCHLHDQRTNGRGGLRPASRATRIRPARRARSACQRSRVPRGDNQVHPLQVTAGQQSGQPGRQPVWSKCSVRPRRRTRSASHSLKPAVRRRPSRSTSEVAMGSICARLWSCTQRSIG